MAISNNPTEAVNACQEWIPAYYASPSVSSMQYVAIPILLRITGHSDTPTIF